MKSLTKSLKDIGFLTIALTLALAANFAYGQWQDPPNSPPNDNLEAPVNVGSVNQFKSGSLGALKLYSSESRATSKMWSPQYCDQNGSNCFTNEQVANTASKPPVCTGANRALQWDGSSWSCATGGSTARNCAASSGYPARNHLETADKYNESYSQLNQTFTVSQCRDGSWSKVVTLYGGDAERANR
jgi:hypothetical protein